MSKYLAEYHPELLEESRTSANSADWVCFIPVEEKAETIIKSELSQVDFLKAIQTVYLNWVVPGTNLELGYSPLKITHNVSNTITVRDWDEAFKFIFDNKESFCGVSFLPETGDKIYKQAPFTEVLDLNQIVEKYGDAVLFASGLIVDSLHAFNQDLWDACESATTRGISLDGSRVTVFVKKDIITRIKKFSRNYFKGNMTKTIECLKDVHLYHKWVSINRALEKNPINFDKIDYSEKYQNADELSGVACSGGACEIF